MAKSVQVQLAEKAVAMGWTLKQTMTGKMQEYVHPSIANRLYLGSNGALRYGKNRTSSNSIESLKVRPVEQKLAFIENYTKKYVALAAK